MPTPQEFKEVIQKELQAMYDRIGQQELLQEMNKQSLATVADLIKRMDQEDVVPDGYERQVAVGELYSNNDEWLKNSIGIATSTNDNEDRDFINVWTSGGRIVNPEPKTLSLGIEDKVESVEDIRKVAVIPSSDPSCLYNKLTTPSGLLENIVTTLLSNYLAAEILALRIRPSHFTHAGPVKVRFDLPVIYQELKDINKLVDREMDLHLNVMEWVDGPFISVLQKRPSGFYCFTNERDYVGKDFVISVKAHKAMTLLTYNTTTDMEPILEIYADVTQDVINDKFIDDMLNGFKKTLATMVNYALESPESRKARLRSYHMCSLS